MQSAHPEPVRKKKKLAGSEFLFYMADIRSYSFATIKDKIEEKTVRYIFCQYFFVDTVPLALSPKFKKITAVFWVDDGPARASMEGGGEEESVWNRWLSVACGEELHQVPSTGAPPRGSVRPWRTGNAAGLLFIGHTPCLCTQGGGGGGETQIIYCNECKR